MKSASIIVNNLSVKLQGITVLDAVSFELEKGEHLAITGTSGSGKTILAKALAGQLFSKGNLAVSFDKDSPLQQKIVLVEQRYQFKNLSNVSDFYYQQRFNSYDAEDAPTIMEELIVVSPGSEARIELLLSQFGMQHRKDAPVIQLSSGEHKRFQLIKALIDPPQVLILDTPYTGLDAKTRIHLNSIINAIAENGTQIILITGADEIPGCITHVAVMENGCLKSFREKEYFIPAAVSIVQDNYLNLHSIPFTEKREDDFIHAVKMINVSVKYGNKTILNNINWQVNPGERWLLKGVNGAGKSTLLSLLNGDNPQAYANEIYLFDKRRGSGESIWDIKQKIGFVSPELQAYFDKSIDCYHVVASGFFDTTGLYKKLNNRQQSLLQQWFEFLSLSHLRNKPLAAVSGGEQKMVLLARALIKDPPLLILDEPCQGLDEYQKNNFIQLADELCEHLNKTMIYVSHYENEIPQCIDKVLQLDNGSAKIYSISKQTALAV